MLHILVLGSAAGGGFPQWNSNDAPSRRARAGEIPSRTQSSLAISADARRWVLLNASPDIRQQIDARRQLQPRSSDARRSSPIAAVVLTNADVDHVAGLLSLRESQPFVVYAHRRTLDVLAANSIFKVLNRDYVGRRALPLDSAFELRTAANAPLGLTVTAFAVPGKASLWCEDESDASLGTREGDTIGLEIRADGTPMFYVPGCAAMTEALAARLKGAALVFFDGTLWRDDEMILQGVGKKTGRRMGHMSCSGESGTIAAFETLGVKRKLFIHINNTNPLLLPDSAQRAEAESRGWEVAHDGMEISL
ncbi:MAG TPA: pyrroloquinoline quinone biosynthesis protein PqqB [Candidatus Binataceae bacterium]|nr:pyrroloquinoline quinone biosynthesis protein PqqB [Candidatus Binataceae bacterium]